MSNLQVVAVSARTVTLLLASTGAKYALATPLAWQLLNPEGRELQSGKSTSVAIFIEGLKPDRRYTFTCAHGDMTFVTERCGGLINAADFGVNEQALDNADAFSNAIAAVPQGGTLLVPRGRYVSGPIFLRPSMTLYLPSGSEIAAIGDRTNWPILPAFGDGGRALGTWEGLPEASFASLITAVDCHDLIITGGGIIDGGGDRGDWWSWPKETRNGARRPRTIFLAHCNEITLSGLTIQNSPSWTVHPFNCRRLNASALKIRNPENSPNTDGFNPESCKNVRLTGLDISVGDDCIAIKAGKRGAEPDTHLAPTAQISVTHSRMAHGHGAVVIGSEMSGDVTNVTISDCEFIGTDRGLRLKTRRGRGGQISAISMKNVAMHQVLTPLAINAFYFCDPDGKSDAVQSRQPAPVDQLTPQISNISLSDVTATRVSIAAAAILGLPEAPIRNVHLSNFSVSFDPKAIPAPPLMATGVAPVRHAEILAEYAEVTGKINLIETQEVPPNADELF